MVSRITTLAPSLGLSIGPACEVGLNAAMRKEVCVTPQIRKKEKNVYCTQFLRNICLSYRRIATSQRNEVHRDFFISAPYQYSCLLVDQLLIIYGSSVE